MPWTDISNSASTSLSHTFGSLTDGTSYQYKVRAVNATGESAESDASDAVQPGAATLTASDVEDDTATLTIGNYGAANGWYHKHTTPSNGTCSGKQTAAAASLSSLDSNTNYTLQGLQRQRLLDRAGERDLPDQARPADQAGRGEGGQHQADGDVLRDGRRHAHQVGVQAQGGRRQLRRGLDPASARPRRR